MPRGVKRQAVIQGAVAGYKKNPVRPEMVMAILLNLIECARVPVVRCNDGGEGVTSAVASPQVLLSLPWTGTGNNMSLPQGQTIIMLTRDPTCPMMFYDYNNLGAAGAAQQAVYNWNATNSSQLFPVPASQAVNLTPCWAVPLGAYQPHGNILPARTYGDRVYMQADAPPGNLLTAVSSIGVIVPNQAGLAVGDVIEAAIFRLSEGVDSLVTQVSFTIAVVGVGGNLPLVLVPFTDAYRVRVNYTPAAGNVNLQITVQVQQKWSCGTLCCRQLPQVDTIWGQLNRFRVLGANMDIINSTPGQFREELVWRLRYRREPLHIFLFKDSKTPSPMYRLCDRWRQEISQEDISDL